MEYLIISDNDSQKTIRPGRQDSFRLLLTLKRSNLLLHALVVPRPQLRPVPQEEQNLHPHKQWRQQKCLQQIIQQRGCPALEFPVPDELRQPCYHMDPASPEVDRWCVVRAQQVVCAGRTREDNWCDECPCDGLEEDVEDRVDKSTDRPEVDREVLILESFREVEECRGIGRLS